MTYTHTFDNKKFMYSSDSAIVIAISSRYAVILMNGNEFEVSNSAIVKLGMICRTVGEQIANRVWQVPASHIASL